MLFIVIVLFSWALAQPGLAADTQYPPTARQSKPNAHVQKPSTAKRRNLVLPPIKHTGGKLTVVPKNPQQVVIVPRSRVSARSAAPVTGFRLAPAGPGKLTLFYYSRDPRLVLDTRGSLVIQVDAPASVQVEPSIITRSSWPKSGNSMSLSYKGAARGAPLRLEGKATYVVCDSKSRECRKTITPFAATFVAQ